MGQEGRITIGDVEAMSSDEEYDIVGVEEEANAEARALREAIEEGAFDHLLTKASSHQDLMIQGVSSTEGSSDDDEDVEGRGIRSQSKALSSIATSMMDSIDRMPWTEIFEVTSSSALSFGDGNESLGVHDDLKRELAFYGMAQEAIKIAQRKCADAGVSFHRPDDFFAEMVKTDAHMAKVKDRMIFETKKIDAVAQRKANKEQKLRSKEAQASKVAERARRKKEHIDGVKGWANSAAAMRGGGLNNDDEGQLRKLNSKTPGRKRIAADRKYGFGGKRGRFKQNDPKSMDDMSSFNPQGNFGGKKRTKHGVGSNRKGKRARDAARSRK